MITSFFARRWPLQAFVCICLSGWALTQIVTAAELPDEILLGLKDEKFQVRKNAQSALFEWAKKGDDQTKVQLYQLSQTSEHPEVRRRCFEVVRSLVFDYYENTGEGFVGIMMEEVKVDSEAAPDIEQAVAVTRVIDGHGAKAAGIKAKDRIFGVEGNVAPKGVTMEEFRSIISGLKPKEKVTLLLLRDDKIEKIDVVLGRRPAQVFDPRFGGRQQAEKMEQKAKEEFFEQWLAKRKADN